MNAQTTMPMVFYSMDADEVTAYSVSQILSHVTSSFTDSSVAANGELEAEIEAVEGYTIESVVVLMGGEDVTDIAYDAGVVSIAHVTGNVQIVATAVVTG